MRLRTPIAAILLATLAIAVACTSSGGDETPTPTQVSEEPTPTPGRSSPHTEPQPTPTAESPIPERVDTAKGGPPSSPGSRGRPLTADLPAECVALDGEAETFISNSINAEGVSAIAPVAAVGATGDGILFIASELVGTGSGDMPVAAWGTFQVGASGLTYENTWAANGVAARWSSLPGSEGAESIYGAFAGFEQARECAEIAAQGIFVNVSPTPEPGMPVDFTYSPVRCVAPTSSTTSAIEASLQGGSNGVPEFHFAIMLSPESFGQGATVWRYGADLEGPQEYDGTGPYPVWLKIVERDGSASYYSENDLAANISDLPRPSSADRPPASPADVAHLEQCIRETKADAERPVFQEPELVITPCVTPDSEIQERIARFLKEDARLRNSITVVVERYLGDRLVEGPIYVVAADTGRQDEDNQYAVWMTYEVMDATFSGPVTVSLNEAAGSVSVLPGVLRNQINFELSRYLVIAAGCAEGITLNERGADILPLERDFDPGRCVVPEERIQTALQRSATDDDIEFKAIRMVESNSFSPFEGFGSPLEPSFWFVAAAVEIDGETQTAVWFYTDVPGDNPSRSDIESVSSLADMVSDLSPGGDAEPLIASLDGFLEAKDCVAAALEEEESAEEEEDAVAEATAEAVEEVAEPEPVE